MESLDSNMIKETASFITEEIKNYLMEAAKWGKFLAIVGYIGIGLMMLLAVAVMMMGSGSSLFPGMGMNMGALGFIYIVIGAFYFFPVYYMHQFSLKIKQGLNGGDDQNIAAGFQNLKSLFKFMGIFTVVILSMYAVILIIAIVFGLAGFINK